MWCRRGRRSAKGARDGSRCAGGRGAITSEDPRGAGDPAERAGAEWGFHPTRTGVLPWGAACSVGPVCRVGRGSAMGERIGPSMTPPIFASLHGFVPGRHRHFRSVSERTGGRLQAARTIETRDGDAIARARDARPAQAVRPPGRPRRARPHGPHRHRLRLPRAQRRRQDHDDAHPDGAHPRRQRQRRSFSDAPSAVATGGGCSRSVRSSSRRRSTRSSRAARTFAHSRRPARRCPRAASTACSSWSV